jgi:hypothetical protein
MAEHSPPPPADESPQLGASGALLAEDGQTIGELAEFLWAIHLSLVDYRLSILLALPLDLQLEVILPLTVRERMSLRATCRKMRALTSQPEGWAALAHTLWTNRTRVPASGAYCAPAAAILPAVLVGATLVDACARAPPSWPSRLVGSMHMCDSGLVVDGSWGVGGADSIPCEGIGDVDGFGVGGDGLDVTFAAPTTPLHDLSPTAFAMADAAFPTIRIDGTPAAAAAATPSSGPVAAPPVPVGQALSESGAGDPRPPPPRAALPFCTPAWSLGPSARSAELQRPSWALRLTAHFEACLTSDPSQRGASVCVGLVASEVSRGAHTLAAFSTAMAGGGGGGGAGAGGHAAALHASVAYASLSAAVRGARRGGFFVEFKTAAAVQEERLRAAPPADGAPPPVVAALMWHGTSSQQQRRRLDDVPLGGLRVGDTLGVCIDFVSATVFFTHNGDALSGASLPISIATEWTPAVAATGCASVRMNFGSELGAGGGACALAPVGAVGAPSERGGGARRAAAFAFDVLRFETSLWTEMSGTFAMRALFELEGAIKEGHTSVGWPWSPEGSWARAVEAHLEPWLRLARKAGSEEADHLVRAAGRIQASGGGAGNGGVAGVGAATTREARGGGVARGRGGRCDLPAGVRLFPTPDPLGIGRHEREELASFATAHRLASRGSSTGASHAGPLVEACARAGLSLAHLSALPMERTLALIRAEGVPAGARLRLRQAISSTWGEPLPSACGRRCRTFGWPRPLKLVVLLSPSLPVRSEPRLRAPIIRRLDAGQIVTAVGSCGDWVELAPPPPPRGSSSQSDPPHSKGASSRRSKPGHDARAWVLLDGRLVNQPSPLLRPLRTGDSTQGNVCVGHRRRAATVEVLMGDAARRASADARDADHDVDTTLPRGSLHTSRWWDPPPTLEGPSRSQPPPREQRDEA